MTILQTLVTKREPIESKNSNSLLNEDKKSFERLNKQSSRIGYDEISEEERKHRNFLGLKLKGPIQSEELERLYKKRLSNYSDSKLSDMTESKKQSSLEKREKTERAYKFLSNLLHKET